MKNVKKTLLMLVCVVCLTAVIPFSSMAASKASIKLNSSKLTLYVGETATLKATVTGKSSKVTWKSSSKSVASVSGGKITAKKAGKATITAKANGKTKKCVVTVKKVPGYIKAYKQLLSKSSMDWGTADWTVNPSKCKFALAYIDNNSTPELIIYSNGQTPHFCGYGLVYTYRNGKLTFVRSLNMNNTLYYYKKKGVLIDNYTGMGATTDAYRFLKNGKMYNKIQRDGYYGSSITSIQSYKYFDISSTKTKTISKSTFNSKLKKLVGSKSKTAVKFYSNTAANRKKYIK